MTSEDLLLIGREDVIEVGEDAVQQIGIRIPPRQEQHLCADTTEMGESAGDHAIYRPECQCHHHDVETPPEHGFGILHLRIGEEYQQECQQQIAHRDPFYSQQPLLGFLLDFK